jgi:hypothetical protein
MRFTLGKMFVVVALLAVAFAGMLYRTRWWGHGIFSFSVAMYIAVAIWAIRLRGRSLVAALAFALAGGTYLLFFSSTVGRDALITNEPIALMAQALKLPGTEGANPQGVWTGYGSPSGSTGLQSSLEETTNRAWPWPPPALYAEIHAFILIGHCIFSWLFALLAAWFAGRMYDRRAAITP